MARHYGALGLRVCVRGWSRGPTRSPRLVHQPLHDSAARGVPQEIPELEEPGLSRQGLVPNALYRDGAAERLADFKTMDFNKMRYSAARLRDVIVSADVRAQSVRGEYVRKGIKLDMDDAAGACGVASRRASWPMARHPAWSWAPSARRRRRCTRSSRSAAQALLCYTPGGRPVSRHERWRPMNTRRN